MDTIQLALFGVALFAVAIAFVSLVIALRAHAKYKRLYVQYDYFMRGKDAESLEGYFAALQGQVESLAEDAQRNKDMLRVVNRNIRASLQRCGLVRYNAFSGMGGNMSFALALLDYTNTGYVFNCVHSREGCFVYVKEVDAGTTEVELGSEERDALEQALGYREKKEQ